MKLKLLFSTALLCSVAFFSFTMQAMQETANDAKNVKKTTLTKLLCGCLNAVEETVDNQFNKVADPINTWIAENVYEINSNESYYFDILSLLGGVTSFSGGVYYFVQTLKKRKDKKATRKAVVLCAAASGACAVATVYFVRRVLSSLATE